MGYSKGKEKVTLTITYIGEHHMKRKSAMPGQRCRKMGKITVTALIAAGLMASSFAPAQAGTFSQIHKNPDATIQPVGPAVKASNFSLGLGFQRTNLIYNSAQRTAKQWQQNIVGVQANGALGTTQLFDSYILTVDKLDGKDIVYNPMTQAEMKRLLDVQFADAAQLNAAAKATGKTVKIALSVPWIHNNEWFDIPGYGWVSTTNATDRNRIMTWYLDEVSSRAAASQWSNAQLTGMFYAREDIINSRGDDVLVKHMNSILDAKNLTSVWVPYYDAPNAFTGEALGFDRVTVQPSYSFKNREDGGIVDASRIYAAAGNATGSNTGIEYEIRGSGDTSTATSVARQYLAISQETGLAQKPMVFFTGIEQNIFDRMGSQATTPVSRWNAYTDITKYLNGQTVTSLDTLIPWTPTGKTTQTQTVALNGNKATTIRMDFKDAGTANAQRWSGKVTVKSYDATGQDLGTSYGIARTATDTDALFRSVLVQVPQSAKATKVDITVSPSTLNIASMVSPKMYYSGYELYDTSASTGKAVFTSSNDETTTQFADSPATSQGFAKGKLTDGMKSSDGTWWGTNADRIVGWSMVESNVIIDLGQEYSLSSFDMGTFQDTNAGVAWPQGATAMATKCPQGLAGTVATGCDITGIALGLPGSRSLAPGQGTARYDTVKGSFNAGAKSRYVSVGLTAAGWGLLDEIRVYDINGVNVANGKPYTLVSKPRNMNNGYKNNGLNLSDGTIPVNFVPSLFTGFERTQAQWLSGKFTNEATVNMAKAWIIQDNSWGISLPQTAIYSWQNSSGVWTNAGNVTPTLENGKYVLNMNLSGKNAKAVRINFPVESGGWTMVSEMTLS